MFTRKSLTDEQDDLYRLPKSRKKNWDLISYGTNTTWLNLQNINIVSSSSSKKFAPNTTRKLKNAQLIDFLSELEELKYWILWF